MVCEKCNQNKATVHMQEIVNGEKSETHLCQSCATQLDMPISINNFFLGFLDSYFGAPEIDLTLGTTVEEKVKCKKCGLTYNDFRKTSKLGCSECYTTFRKELTSVLKNIQGSSTHVGKFPKTRGQAMFAKREIEKLRVELMKAIENEEYEEAAQIRDKIRALEVSQ